MLPIHLVLTFLAVVTPFRNTMIAMIVAKNLTYEKVDRAVGLAVIISKMPPQKLQRR